MSTRRVIALLALSLVVIALAPTTRRGIAAETIDGRYVGTATFESGETMVVGATIYVGSTDDIELTIVAPGSVLNACHYQLAPTVDEFGGSFGRVVPFNCLGVSYSPGDSSAELRGIDEGRVGGGALEFTESPRDPYTSYPPGAHWVLAKPAGPPISIGDTAGVEGNSGTRAFMFPVTLSASSASTVTVSYGIQDGTATVGDGDYNAASGTVTFPPLQTVEFVTVLVNGDSDVEPDETFSIVLSNPTNATIADGTGTGTIINDDTSAVDFDWTVPDRFGFDKDGDGLVDYYAPDGSLIISSDRWRVDFTYSDADANGCQAGLTDSWKIDGVTILPDSDPGVMLDNPSICRFSYGFPAEGKYHVTLNVKDAANGAVVGTKERDVIVQDWLIVSLGDSVASGEGNPDVPGGAAAQWENEQCHRSAFAGPAQAAIALERADPKTSVTFIHLACSGAKINAGLLGPYAGVIPGALLPPQLDQLRSLVGDREVDAILISIGANDVTFSNIVKLCFIGTDCGTGLAAKLFANKIVKLPAGYTALSTALDGLSVPPGRNYITEYFDPTRNDTGAFCGTILSDSPMGGPRSPFQVTPAEAEWASNTMMTGLNSAVATAAALHRWTYVGGIRSPFLAHGYCAADHWVDRFSESMALQGDENGTLHPNHEGQAAYGSRIAPTLTASFYTGGDLAKPRLPR